MNEHLSTRSTTTVGAALPVSSLPPFLQLAHARSRRNPRLALPVAPPRLTCAVSKRLRAARHALELAAWQASGGDYLRSMHRPAA